MEWFRLYNEFANDPKLLSFSKSERYDVVCLLCLASSSQERGTLLLEDEDLAGYLSVSLDDFLKFAARLIKKTILERTPEGWLRFVHWTIRQPHSDSAAGRMRAYRERQKSHTVQNSSVECSTPLRNGDVTVTNRSEQNRTEKNDDDARARPKPAIQHADDTFEEDWRKDTEECYRLFVPRHGKAVVDRLIGKAREKVCRGEILTDLVRYVRVSLENGAADPKRSRAAPDCSTTPEPKFLEVPEDERAAYQQAYEAERLAFEQERSAAT